MHIRFRQHSAEGAAKQRQSPQQPRNYLPDGYIYFLRMRIQYSLLCSRVVDERHNVLKSGADARCITIHFTTHEGYVFSSVVGLYVRLSPRLLRKTLQTNEV